MCVEQRHELLLMYRLPLDKMRKDKGWDRDAT